MNKFKITPKIALIIVLVLITITGIVVYLSYNKKAKSNPTVADSGFLSFFGGRKVKPNDESTIPGVIPNQGGDTGGLVGGNTAGQDTSGDTTGGNTSGNTSNGGKLMLRPIGNSNLSLNDNNGNTVNGGSGSSTAGNTGGNTNNGTVTAGNTGGGSGGTTSGGNTIPQIDCTPPTLPYTQPQIEELKELNARFYRISANLHTASDVQNELDTQKSYFDLYTQATNYTKQCYKELADPANKTKAVNASAKHHPYITEKVLALIRKYDPRVIIAEKNDVKKIDDEIAELNSKLMIANAQVYFLNNLSTRTDNQEGKLKSLNNYDIPRLNEEIDYKKNQKWAFQNTKLVLMYYEVLGSFFEEDEYLLPDPNDPNKKVLSDLKVARPNVNLRYNRIWGYTKELINNRGQNTQVIDNMWTVGNEYYNYNPLKPLAQDRLDSRLNDAPNGPNGEPQSWAHRFRLIETALRIW